MSSILRQFVSKSLRFSSSSVLRRHPSSPACPSRALSPSWGPPRPVVQRKDVEFRVIESLCKHEKIDKNAISLCSHLTQELGLDSLDVIECVVHLEDEFKLEINETETEALLTVSAVVDLIVAKMESQVDQNQRPDIEFKEGMTYGRPMN